MIVTGENRSTGTKTCPSVILSTVNLTWNALDVTHTAHLRDQRETMDRWSEACDMRKKGR